MATLPQKKKPTKAQKNLAARIAGYEVMVAKYGSSGYTKPGSNKK